jgi:hypothetical protein
MKSALELCWGVQAAWLGEGGKVSVMRAPTRFGKVAFDLRRDKMTLVFDYHLAPAVRPEQVNLHVPRGLAGIASVRISGQARNFNPGERVVRLD